MRKFYKSALTLAAGAAMLAGVAMTPSISLAWGDNSNGGRRSYTIDQINHGVLGDKVVFNSISDGVIGDEKNFVGAREYTGINAGVNNVWNANEITVQNGKEYLVRLYVHNNNPNGLDAVSHNTRVAFDVPEISSKNIQVNGFIYSDNASPSEYWDYVNFVSDQNFHLEYVWDSASVENNGYASQINGGAKALGNEIVTKAHSERGVQIGYESANGEIPGCFTYAQYVSIRVKAVFDEDNHAGDYTISEKVRLETDTEWAGKTVEAKPGDIVEFQVTYQNTSSYDQENVMIKTILPRSLEYIPGSTRLYNAANPNWLNISQDYIATDKAINIGNYKPRANAFIRFKAVVKGDYLQYGSNTLVNWTQGGVYPTTIQDFAAVTVHVAEATQAQEYNVTVKYVYEDGTKAADSYTGKYAKGDSFAITSPVIDGYTADQPKVTGTMGTKDLTYTVKYTKNPVEDPKDPTIPDAPVPDDTDPVVPEDPTDEPAIKDLPHTGPIAGSVLGLGALTTSAGYYIASRRALRK